MKRRRAILVLAALLGGATAAWADFTANPPMVTVDCAGSTSGSAAFQVFWNGVAGNTVTLVPVGVCTSFGMMPSSHVYTAAGNFQFSAYINGVPNPTSCTFELRSNPPPFPFPTVQVNTINCGGAAGTLDVSPPELAFGTVPEGSFATLPFDVYNNTGVELTDVMYMLSTGAGEVFQFDPPCPGLYSCGQAWAPGTGVPPGGSPVPGLPQVRCNGSTTLGHIATLYVSANSGAFFGMSNVTCDGGPSVGGPQISVASSITLPDTDVFGGASNSDNLTVYNSGDADLIISSVGLVGTASTDWSVAGCVSNCTIGAGANQDISVTFDPTAVFDRSIQIQINHNDLPDNPTYVDAHGTGLGGIISAVPSGGTLGFGDQPVGTTPSTPIMVSVTNSGNQDLDVSSSIDGINAGDFDVTPLGMTGVPPATVDFLVTCTPSATGARSACT
jgi:hypothetical protein